MSIATRASSARREEDGHTIGNALARLARHAVADLACNTAATIDRSRTQRSKNLPRCSLHYIDISQSKTGWARGRRFRT